MSGHIFNMPVIAVAIGLLTSVATPLSSLASASTQAGLEGSARTESDSVRAVGAPCRDDSLASD